MRSDRRESPKIPRFPAPTPSPLIFMPKVAAPAPSTVEPASYEAALQELEALVGCIEAGQLPLEQMLESYQRGAQLLQFCRQRLQSVQDQIQLLDEGSLKPWVAE